MTPEMIAALAANRKSVTAFIEIDFPSGTRRMLIGSGEAIWGSTTYKGYDPTFGSITGGDSISEDANSQAPNTSLTVAVASTATKSDIAADTVQLSPVKIWLAALALDSSSHVAAVPDPELQFDGFIDQATISIDQKKDEVDYTVISAFDYFFEASEGQRLSDDFHETVWPGEKGLANVTGVARKIYWGAYGPAGSSGVATPTSLAAGSIGGVRTSYRSVTA